MIFLLCILQAFWSENLCANNEALRALDNILLSKDSSQEEKEQCRKKIVSCIKNLQSKQSIDVVFNLPFLKEGHKGKYLPLNPSIMKTDDGYDVVCRVSNICLPFYQPIIPGERSIDRNFFLRYDKTFNLLDEHEIIIPPNLPANIIHDNQIRDCRIFRWNEASYYTGWVCVENTKLQKFVFGKFNGYGKDIPKTIENLTVFRGPQANRFEKNWLPILREEKLAFIYSYSPFVILQPNLDNGECETYMTYSPSLDFSLFRGSAAPIEFEDGYLMMVHEILQTTVHKVSADLYYEVREYGHRFLYLNKNLIITKVSTPFTFNHSGVEFCLAMSIDHSGENLIIPIGIQDEQAKILVVDLHYIKSLLYDIPHKKPARPVTPEGPEAPLKSKNGLRVITGTYPLTEQSSEDKQLNEDLDEATCPDLLKGYSGDLIGGLCLGLLIGQEYYEPNRFTPKPLWLAYGGAALGTYSLIKKNNPGRPFRANHAFRWATGVGAGIAVHALLGSKK